MRVNNFMVPSPAWTDPAGRLVIGAHDIRPFKNAGSQHSQFFVFYNTFDAEIGYRDLSKVAHLPYGMAWSVDNQSLYYSDGFTKSVIKCSFDLLKGDVSDCEELLDLSRTFEVRVSAGATPRGIAVDMNNHIWVALAENEDKGAVIEIDPVSGSIISIIGKQRDSVEGDSFLGCNSRCLA